MFIALILFKFFRVFNIFFDRRSIPEVVNECKTFCPTTHYKCIKNKKKNKRA